MKMLSEINLGEKLGNKAKMRKIFVTLTDCFFLFVIFCLSYRIQVGLTTFYIDINPTFWRRLYKLSVLAAGFKAVMNCKDKTLWLSIPVAAVFYIAFPHEHYLWQAFYAPLIVGCVGVNVRKIFYAAFVPATVVIFNMMIAAIGGGIENMASPGENVVSYWGHISPTDFGTAVFCIVIFWWVSLKELPDYFSLITAVFSLFISFVITKCDTSSYLTVLFIGILVGRIFYRKILKDKINIKWFLKLVDSAMVIAFPVLGLFMIAMVFAYYREFPFTGTLDKLLHSRLSPAANMLSEYGIKPFGTYFDMRGWGGSIITYGKYTFIDSSYPQILIRYGWVTYIVACVTWSYTTWRAIKTGNRRLAYAMSLFALDFVMEHHWYELSYNVFLIIIFSNFNYSECIIVSALNVFRERCNDKKYAIFFTGSVIASLAAGFLFLPMIFSWLRTIFGGYGLHGGGRRGFIMFLAITLMLIVALNIILSLSLIVADATIKKAPNKKVSIMFIICLGLIALSLATGNLLINRVLDTNISLVNSERNILEQICSNKKGNVYAGKLPELYVRNIKDISRSYLYGEDFSRYRDASIITDASWDSACLSARGFLYLQISDKDAIYTNDDSVINVLEESGYKLKGYNSYEYDVDLNPLAEMNNLDILADGGLRLEGTEHQLIYGPYVTLYEGKFSAKYEMMLLKDIPDNDEKICTLRVSSYYGDNVITTVDLFRSDFGNDGYLNYEVDFNGGGQGFEFLVFTEDGVELKLKSITYRRKPELDIHRKIDYKGRTVRAEYYDLEGNPYEFSGRYYGCEYAYNDNDLAIMQKFLDSDFKPFITKEGYAEVHREYNLKKQVTRESYYGIDGKAVEDGGGCHSVEKEYDSSGNLISGSYYDLEGNPVLANGAYFKYIRIFNGDNRWIRTEYYDVNDKLILQNGGYAIVERDYDDVGNVKCERYYGINREPVLLSGKYSMIDFSYDKNGKMIKRTFKDMNGNVVEEQQI